jgi:prepilin-type N-terminal cleavage/methylation domain-containing protein
MSRNALPRVIAAPIPIGPVWQSSPVQRRSAGFSLPELLVALVILAALALMVIPATQKLFRRIRTESTVSGIQRTLNQARLQAIKGGTQVVVQAEQGPAGSPIQLTSFVDANGNFSLDSGERVLTIYSSGWSRMVYWKHGGTAGDLNTAVPFDITYTPALPDTTTPTTIKHLIAFLGNGGIVVPADSAIPTATDGRGIYVADDSGLNFFRVTIYSNLISKPVVEKYDAGSSTYMKAGGSQWQ